MVDTPDLGSGAARCGGSSPLIRTIVYSSQTPLFTAFQPLCETFEKLNQTEKLLKKYNLFNTQYLLHRNSIYYFVLRIDKKTVYRKSLCTSNLIFAIMTKIKILNRLSSMGFGHKGYTTFIGKNSFNLVAENEEEEKLLKEIEKTVVSKIKRLSKNHRVSVETDEIRDTITLKKVTDEYITVRETFKISPKVMMKFKQSIEYLLIYFGEKKLVKEITPKGHF